MGLLAAAHQIINRNIQEHCASVSFFSLNVKKRKENQLPVHNIHTFEPETNLSINEYLEVLSRNPEKLECRRKRRFFKIIRVGVGYDLILTSSFKSQ